MKPKTPTPREGKSRNLASHYGEAWLEAEAFAESGARRRRAFARCKDGRLRVVMCGLPDTMFSVPASARISRRTIRGFVMIDDGELKFFPDKETAP